MLQLGMTRARLVEALPAGEATDQRSVVMLKVEIMGTRPVETLSVVEAAGQRSAAMLQYMVQVQSMADLSVLLLLPLCRLN